MFPSQHHCTEAEKQKRGGFGNRDDTKPYIAESDDRVEVAPPGRSEGAVDVVAVRATTDAAIGTIQKSFVPFPDICKRRSKSVPLGGTKMYHRVSI